LNCMQGGGLEPKILKEGDEMASDEDIGAVRGYAIRKLTPKEYWRLMDFDDEDFDRAEQVNSNTQLYKQAGNSIVVNCLVAIFGQMFEGKEDSYKDIDGKHFKH